MKSVLFKCASAVFIGFFLKVMSVNAQSEETKQYWFNVQSTPVQIVIKNGSRSDRIDEFIENISNGEVTEIQIGCIILEKNRFEVVLTKRAVKIGLSPASSKESKVLLPKGSHGSDLSICSGSAKVTILAVKFADGAKWTIQ